MAAMRKVSRTPLNWRTKTTSKKTPTAIRMYCRYVETTSLLAGTLVSDRGLYEPKYTSPGRLGGQVYSLYAPLYNRPPVCEGVTYRRLDMVGRDVRAHRHLERITGALRFLTRPGGAAASSPNAARPERRTGPASTADGASWP